MMQDPLYRKTYYATHPEMMEGASNNDLRDRHLVSDLFITSKIILDYSHGERFIIGGAVPAGGMLELPTQIEPESAAGHPLLERREMACVNIGAGGGVVTVDGVEYDLAKHEALYIPMGSQHIVFSGEDARFYLLSVPAHRAFPIRKLSLDTTVPMERGALETSNERTIYQLILPGLCESASLCLGLTILKPGSVWNTMPPHIHERRSEVYLYFGLPEDGRLFHFMGQEEALRHIVMKNEEVVIRRHGPFTWGQELRLTLSSGRWPERTSTTPTWTCWTSANFNEPHDVVSRQIDKASRPRSSA